MNQNETVTTATDINNTYWKNVETDVEKTLTPSFITGAIIFAAIYLLSYSTSNNLELEILDENVAPRTSLIFVILTEYLWIFYIFLSFMIKNVKEDKVMIYIHKQIQFVNRIALIFYGTTMGIFTFGLFATKFNSEVGGRLLLLLFTIIVILLVHRLSDYFNENFTPTMSGYALRVLTIIMMVIAMWTWVEVFPLNVYIFDTSVVFK